MDLSKWNKASEFSFCHNYSGKITASKWFGEI